MSFAQLTDSHEVKCRKSHECAWCGKFIEKGSKAISRSYIWESGPQTDWMHHECNDAMHTAPRDVLNDGWLPGDFVRGSTEWA